MFKGPTKYSEYIQDVPKSIDYILKRVNAVTVADLQAVTNAGATTTLPINTGGITSDYFQLDTAATPTLAPGMFGWDDAYGTADLRLKGNNVTLQLGQELLARVVNKTGADLLESQYKVVRVRIASEGGAQGQRLAVVLAQGDNDPDSATTLGLVTENIANNQEGFITIFGNVNNINTTGSLQGETWVDGDVLYLSPTIPGAITKVKPVAPQHTVIIGYVVYAHINQGKIFVKVDNGYELDELHNVLITSPANNDLLQYDSAQQVWKNVAPSIAVPTPTLAQVTTAGNTTTNAITVGGLTVATNLIYTDTVNGRVGIGTTGLVPGILLTINGSVSIAAGQSLKLDPSANIYMVAASSQFRVYTGAIAALSISNTGNVLINTTTDAGYKLDVNGTARVVNSLTVNNNVIVGSGVYTPTVVLSATNLYRTIQNDVGGLVIRTNSYGLQINDVGTGSLNNAFLTVSGSKTASSALAQGVYFNNTLVAAANNDVLVGLDIAPTFTNGAFTGVTNLAARIQGNTEISRTGADTQLTVARGGGASFTIQGKANSTSQSEGVNLYWTNNTWLKFVLGSSVVANFSNVGNLLVGTSTDAGYKLDINGQFRANGESILASASGNVGIGTVSPTSKLHINGADPFLRVNNVGSTNTHGIKISYNSSDTQGFHLLYNPPAAAAYLDNTYLVTSGQPYGDIYFRQNVSGTMTTRMTIKADGGNVGIGTSNPLYKLHVTDSAGDIVYILASTGQSAIIGATGSGTNRMYIGYSPGAENISITSSGVVRLNSITSGNVLIGTTTDAGYKLDVNGNVSIKGSAGTTGLYADFGNTGSVVQIASHGSTDFTQIRIGNNFNLSRNGGGDPSIETTFGLGVISNSLNLQTSTNAPGKLWIRGNYGLGSAYFGANNSNGTTPSTLYFQNSETPAAEQNVVATFNFWGISDNATAPSIPASSMFSLQSTTRGFLQPRMTNAQAVAITTPATGLQVYDTTNNKNLLYNGTVWQNIATETWVSGQGYLTSTPTLDQVVTAGNSVSNNGITITRASGATLTLNPGASDNAIVINNSGFIKFTSGADSFIRGYSTVFSVLDAGFVSKVQFHWGGSASYINTGGNFLIGTTTDAGYKLDVVGGDSRFNGVRVGLGGGGVGSNTVVGNGALALNTTGDNLIAIGSALVKNTTGVQNIGIGNLSLRENTTGSYNTAIGYWAGFAISTGSQNTLLGRYAGNGIATGSSNVAIGMNSLYNSATAPNNNVSIGTTAMQNGSGDNNIAIGTGVLYNNTASNNTAVGHQAASSNVSGTEITAIGYQSLYNNTGSYNTAVGFSSLNLNTTGIANTAVGRYSAQKNTTGNYNTSIGYNANWYNSTGSNNTALGFYALYDSTASNNTALGYQAGFAGVANTTGSNNIFIGYQATGVSATDSNRTWIGNSSTTSTWLAGNVLIGTTTDAGYKLDVNGSTRIKGTGTTDSTIALLVQNNTGRLLLQSDDGGFTRIGGPTARLYVGVESGGAAARLVVNGEGLFSNGGIGNAGGFYIDQGGTSSASRTIWYDGSGTPKNLITGNGDNYITSGNFGLGTTTPTDKLHIVDNTNGNKFGRISAGGTDASAAWVAQNDQVDNVVYRVFGSAVTGSQMGISLARSASLMANLGGSGKFLVGTYSSTDFVMGTGNQERMRLVDSTGNFLIGTTTDNGNKLQVSGNIDAQGYKVNNVLGYTGILNIPTNPPGQQNIDIQGGIVINIF